VVCSRTSRSASWSRAVAEGRRSRLRYMRTISTKRCCSHYATARDHEAERLVRLQTTADHREAVQAFIDKRKAVFREADG